MYITLVWLYWIAQYVKIKMSINSYVRMHIISQCRGTKTELRHTFYESYSTDGANKDKAGATFNIAAAYCFDKDARELR